MFLNPGEEEKCYKCKICDKAYFIPSLLKRHMLNHTGEKPYKCDHCPKAFRSAGQRINHQRIHTGEYILSLLIRNQL